MANNSSKLPVEAVGRAITPDHVSTHQHHHATSMGYDLLSRRDEGDTRGYAAFGVFAKSQRLDGSWGGEGAGSCREFSCIHNHAHHSEQAPTFVDENCPRLI